MQVRGRGSSDYARRGATLLLAALASCSPTAPSVPAGERSQASWPPFTFEMPRSSEPARAARTLLDVPGFLPAVLVIPPGDEPRPLVFAAHGAGGAPEWDCEYWDQLTESRAFVLCPRGTAMGAGSFYFKHHHALAAELEASVAAARQKFPRISKTSGIYAGFSQGASMGALMIAERADQFPYVVLIEGFTQWNIALGRAFKSRGGDALLFVCGTRECAAKAAASTVALERAAVRARLEHAVGAGHTPSGPVMRLVEQSLPWLLANDPVWGR